MISKNLRLIEELSAIGPKLGSVISRMMYRKTVKVNLNIYIKFSLKGLKVHN